MLRELIRRKRGASDEYLKICFHGEIRKKKLSGYSSLKL